MLFLVCYLVVTRKKKALVVLRSGKKEERIEEDREMKNTGGNKDGDWERDLQER